MRERRPKSSQICSVSRGYPRFPSRDGINYAYSRALHSTPFCTGCNLTGTFGSCFARDEREDPRAAEGEGEGRPCRTGAKRGAGKRETAEASVEDAAAALARLIEKGEKVYRRDGV